MIKKLINIFKTDNSLNNYTKTAKKGGKIVLMSTAIFLFTFFSLAHINHVFHPPLIVNMLGIIIAIISAAGMLYGAFTHCHAQYKRNKERENLAQLKHNQIKNQNSSNLLFSTEKDISQILKNEISQTQSSFSNEIDKNS